MNMSTELEDVVAAARRVSRSVKLEQIRLHSSKLETSFLFEPNGELVMKQFVVCHSAIHTSADLLSSMISYALTLETPKDGEPNPEDVDLSLHAHFLLTHSFEHRGSVDEADLVPFAKVDGVAATFPYWREFVQSMTSRAGMNGIVIPASKDEGNLGVYSRAEGLGEMGM